MLILLEERIISDLLGTLVGEGLVDHRFHDPGGERRRQRHDDQARYGHGIAAHMLAAVFGDDPLEHGGDGVGADGRALGSILIGQWLDFPALSRRRPAEPASWAAL